MHIAFCIIYNFPKGSRKIDYDFGKKKKRIVLMLKIERDTKVI